MRVDRGNGVPFEHEATKAKRSNNFQSAIEGFHAEPPKKPHVKTWDWTVGDGLLPKAKQCLKMLGEAFSRKKAA